MVVRVMTEFKHVVVYGDSLSWGIIPLTRRRLDFASRWPQVMARDLNDTAEAAGRDYRVHVTEECLNGRRTAFEDPYKPGRSGLIGIQQVIEAQSPLDVVIIMLGTNDFQSIHRHTPWHSAMGIAAIIDAIRATTLEPEIPVPKILVVAPPALDHPRGPIGPKFTGGDTTSAGLADALRQITAEYGCGFFDANSVITSSTVDGVHLDKEQHRVLGKAVSKVVAQLL